jgi:hypothetical protein
MIAIAIASIALVLSVISLMAAGTIAVRLKLVKPRPVFAGSAPPEQISVPTIGRRIDEVLAPLIQFRMPTDDGEAIMQDSFLVDDGCILLASTSCGACRYLVDDSADLLLAKSVRALVIAPTIDRGKEFMEKDCRDPGIPYQVDPGGERARAIGVTEFPSILTVADGAIASVHVVVARQQLEKVLSLPAKKIDVLAAQGADGPTSGVTVSREETQ